jgi:hypothetical protein
MSTARYLMRGAQLVALVAILALPAMAAGDVAVHTQDGVSFMSGGVGEERPALEAMGQRFNLKLTMALSTGHFVGDARVRIQSPQGRTILDTLADGPLLYAQLQPGTYTVSCSLNGKQLKQTTQITPGAQQQLTFTWAAE